MRKGCNQPSSGPPGITAAPAFGSFYTSVDQSVNIGELIRFPTTLSSLNVDHPNETDFVIQKEGFYFIEYGAANTGDSSQTTLALYINNSEEVIPSRLSVPVDSSLVTISFIAPFSKGDTLNIVNIMNAFTLGIPNNLLSEPTKAFMTITYLSPL